MQLKESKLQGCFLSIRICYLARLKSKRFKDIAPWESLMHVLPFLQCEHFTIECHWTRWTNLRQTGWRVVNPRRFGGKSCDLRRFMGLLRFWQWCNFFQFQEGAFCTCEGWGESWRKRLGVMAQKVITWWWFYERSSASPKIACRIFTFKLSQM